MFQTINGQPSIAIAMLASCNWREHCHAVDERNSAALICGLLMLFHVVLYNYWYLFLLVGGKCMSSIGDCLVVLSFANIPTCYGMTKHVALKESGISRSFVGAAKRVV